MKASGVPKVVAVKRLGAQGAKARLGGVMTFFCTLA